MRVKVKLLIACFSLLLLADSFAAIKSKITGGDSNAKKGGTLTYEFYEPDHINPINFRQAGSIEILVNWVFETLTDCDAVTGEMIPRIAKKWDISKDGKVFTFWIDERAKWADGKPVTAEDVKFSFDVFSMPGANAAFKKESVSDFSKIEASNGVVTFYAKTRLFSHLGFITSTLILPKHLYYYTDPEKFSRNEYIKNPQGSGPYLVKEMTKGERAVLVKNKNYWGGVLLQNEGAYNFDEVIIKYVRDPQIAFEKLKKGDLDYMPIRVGNTELWRQTKTDKAFTGGKIRALEVSSKLQQGYGFVGFNLQNELFKDKRVRRALVQAVNRDEIIEKSLDGLARIPFGPLYSVDNFAGKFTPVKYDPEAALKSLAEVGWKDSDGDYILDKNGKKFSFTVLVPNARIEKEMLFVQNYWKQIGIDCQVKILEYSTWRNLQDERKFDAVSNGKSRDFYPWSVDAYGEWHSNNAKNGLRNYFDFKSSEVDKLIMKAREEFDYKKRKAMLDKVNDVIAEEYVMFQYSESKYALHAVSSNIVMPTYNGTLWFPYTFGMKYWYKK